MNVWAFLLAISLGSLPVSAQTVSARDSERLEAAAAAEWETVPEPSPVAADCSHLLDGAFAPVTFERRSDALARLASTQVVEITDSEAIEFAGHSLRSPSGLPRVHAFLVRGVAKNDVPAFEITVCGDVLHVIHSSLGRSTPPSRRVPLVVLLERAPTRMEVGWRMAL